MSIQNDSIAIPEAQIAPETGTTPSRRIWLPFHFAMAAALVLLVFIFNRPNVNDPDIWWHLNDAQQTLHGHIPRADTFSWTARGSAWMDHEWLAEIPFYAAYKTLGLRGLYGFSFLLSSVILCLILYRSAKLTGDVKNSFVVGVYCVLLTVVSFGPRMLLFGWLYMLIMLIALDRFKEGNDKAIWVIPPIFLLWVNSHGSWMIGLAVYAIIAGAGLVQFDFGQVESRRWSGRQLKTLIIVGLLSVIVLFANPYGYKLVTYPFDMAFHQKLNIEHVEEWASVNFHNARGKIVFIAFLGTMICAFLSKKKIALSELLLLLLAFYSGITYVRFLFLAAILISPFLSERIHLFPAYDPKIDKPLMNLLFGVVVLGIILYRFPSEARLAGSLDEKFPTKSTAYLQQHGIHDHVLTHFFWGGYLERNLPETPVFVDSRVDIYEYNGTLKDYLDLIGIKDPLAILDRRKIQYVYFYKDEPLVYLLKQTGKWDVQYEDNVSILLKRR
jgi:hypothetical protein